MRQWPARVKVEIIRKLDQDPTQPGDCIMDQQTHELVVEGLCADAVLRKIKDHYLAIDKNTSIKFLGPVEWMGPETIGKIALSF